MNLTAIRPLGVDLFCLGKKYLVFNLVSRNIKVKYRRSILGLFWTLIGPIAMAVMYFFVFRIILKVQIPHYPVFILAGVLPWTFFVQSLMEGMESIVISWGLISKIPVPTQIFPYVGTVTNLVTLFMSLPVLLIAGFISGVPTGPSIIMVIPYFAAFFLITYSLSLLLAIAFVFFRDLRHIMAIILQIWFYATPVIYDESMIPPQFSWVLYANPVGALFVGLHDVLVRGIWPRPEIIWTPMFWAAGLLFLSAWVQKRFGRGLVEII